MTNKNTEVKKSNRIWLYLIFSLIICGFLLSFHILTSEFTIVAKKSLTFQKTFITEDDEIKILEKIYFGSLIEQSEMSNDELANKIKKNWEVYEKNNSRVFKHNDGRMIIISYD
jgi:hypothetical protein